MVLGMLPGPQLIVPLRVLTSEARGRRVDGVEAVRHRDDAVNASSEKTLSHAPYEILVF